MKFKLILFICLSLFFLFSSCIRTLKPLFDNHNQLYFEDGLIGKWTGNKGVNNWEFLKNEDINLEKTYLIKHFEKENDRYGDTTVLIGMLGKIGKNHFLDLYPYKFDYLKNNFLANLHIVFAHTFHRIKFIDTNKFVITSLDNNWLIKNVKKIKPKIDFIRKDHSGSSIIITSSSATLRKFCLNYGNNNNAFSSSDTLMRLK